MSALMIDMSNWQLIETAPKDGTVLLSIKGTTQRVVYWDDGAFFKGWFVQCTDSGGGSFFDPTHWMPLPPPPHTKGM